MSSSNDSFNTASSESEEDNTNSIIESSLVENMISTDKTTKISSDSSDDTDFEEKSRFAVQKGKKVMRVLSSSEEDEYEDQNSIKIANSSSDRDANSEERNALAVTSNVKTSKKAMKVVSSEEEDDEEEEESKNSTRFSNNREKCSYAKVEDTQRSNREERKGSNRSSFGSDEASKRKELSIDKSKDGGNAQNTETFNRLGRQSYRESLAIINSRSPSPESEDELKITDLSSDDETNFFPSHQSTIRILENADELKENKNPNKQIIDVSDSTSKIEVSSDNTDSRTSTDSSKLKVTNVEYEKQAEILQNLRSQVAMAKKTIQSVNLNALPDKGAALLKRHEDMLKNIKEQEAKLSNMVVTHIAPKATNPLAWKVVEAQINTVQPKTFGKKALQTLNTQKALTMDRLEQIHGALSNCPQKDAIIETPKGLKVELMPHQKHALAWLKWRKGQKPSGGILADDMGLGKTLTMIAFTLHDLNEEGDDEDDSDLDNENNKHRKDYKYPGGILVVCPASLIYQWSGEIAKHIKRGLLSVESYHGANRENKSKRLAKHDFVITTYTLAMNDYAKSGPLFNIKWQHIILDEAHQIRNYKSQTSIAVCNLSGKSRWALTGTPVHNKELDIFALLKFLRCSPFDDLPVWKRWVSDKTTGGQDRLNMVMSSLILRRTKQQLSEKNLLPSLPEKTWKLIEITLSKQELNVYQKVLIFSRTLFAQFLHQRAEKNADNMPGLSTNPNDEYYKMHKRLVAMNGVKKIKQHEILVLLLRLRQICCHPSLITGMLGDEVDIQDIDGDDHFEEMNLLDQLNKLNIQDEPEDHNRMSIGGAEVGLAEASKGILNPSNPVFSSNYCSSKINNIVKLLTEILPTGDKVIIVSQWTSFLHLVASHLKENDVQFYSLDGTVPVPKRMEIVDGINNPAHKVQILLLSLTAGGVGLNLVGANHLVLADLHWNPQLEMQAQDRIFRLGQTKPVTVYKFLTLNTIEQRIKNLQDNKLGIAEQLLTGAKIQHHNKLSLDDLKMLFNM